MTMKIGALESSMNLLARTSIVVLVLLVPHAAYSEMVSGWPVREVPGLLHALSDLDRAIREEEYRQINSLIIIQDGELLYEHYYNGAGRNETHNPRSVGKTIVAPILGLAIANGYLQGLDQRLGELYDLKSYLNYSARKDQVTLRHLATMTSGFEGFDFVPESIGNEENMYPQPDWVKWTLDLPMSETREPGESWRYFTAGIVVVGDILNQVLPGGLEVYAHKHLFEPLGISNYEWQHTPQKVANTAGGIQLTPLDFAKFGELHRNDGMWGDKRVLPAGWARKSITPVVDTTIKDDRYGLLWWNKSYTVSGSKWETSYCSGNGGNKIFVFPEQDLVIVVTASAYGQRYMHSQVDKMLNDHVLPAVASIPIQ
jgi:CubicO group peptidase (beta-lactamase class C family)